MKKPVAIILVVVVLLAAGVGGWLWCKCSSQTEEWRSGN